MRKSLSMSFSLSLPSYISGGNIEVMALGMEDDKYKRGWRLARPIGEHTTGFMLVYDDIDEYYQCHDKTPFVIKRRKKDAA